MSSGDALLDYVGVFPFWPIGRSAFPGTGAVPGNANLLIGSNKKTVGRPLEETWECYPCLHSLEHETLNRHRDDTRHTRGDAPPLNTPCETDATSRGDAAFSG